MLRTVLGLAITSMMLTLFFLLYFLLSPFNKENQSFATSLSDFVFLLGSIHREMSDEPPPAINENAFADAMARFRNSTHWEVRRHALRTLVAWGDSAGPYLVKAAQPGGEPYQLVGVAEALAAISHPKAAELIAPLLSLYANDLRRFRSDLIAALGDTRDPVALPILISTYQRHGNQLGSVLEAIGKCGGVDFLLTQLRQTTDPEAIRALIWPLAYTQTDKAATALSQLLLHPNGQVRLRARSAMSQSMGREVVAPLLALLPTSGDEYLIGGAINQVLARRRNQGAPGLVPYLTSLIDHPTLGWEARYALAQIGGAEAVAALLASLPRMTPTQAMEHLDYLGNDAIAFLTVFFEHPDASVRRQALYKAEDLFSPVTRPLIAGMLTDDVNDNRELARQALYRLDRLDLLRSFANHLPKAHGNAVWSGFRRDLHWGFDSGYRTVLSVFSVLHWIGLCLSAILGLVLIFRRARLFNSYRFNLLASFLLAEGLVGNVFLLGSHWHDPERVFQWATGIHLLLFVGLLCQEQNNRPGDVSNRFARLGGASLWLLMPPLLFLGTPVLAEGMRLIFRDWAYFQWYVGLAVITTLLLIEKAALPSRLTPRAWRVEQALCLLLNSAQLLLFIWPLWLAAAHRHSQQNEDGAVLALLLLLPLLWVYVLRLVQAPVFSRSLRMKVPPPPTPHFAFAVEGDRISVWPQPKKRGGYIALRVVGLLSTGIALAALTGSQGSGAPGMLLAMIAGLMAAALFGLLLDGLNGQVILQVQANAMRAAMTRFGITLRSGEWRFRPVLPPRIARQFRNNSDPSPRFSPAERDWLNTLKEATNPRNHPTVMREVS